MTAGQYAACSRWLGRTPRRARCFRAAFRLLPVLIAAVYAVGAGLLLWQDHPMKWRFLAVPALTFCVVSLLRRWLNFPRPYDQMEYSAFLSAEPGKGKSFPSRHTASAAAIALAFCQVSSVWGAVFWLLAVLVALSRVAGGAHYIRDVAAGLLLPLVFLPLYFL